MDDHQIKKAIAVEIEEGTSGTPPWFRRGKSAGLGLVTKRTVSLIAIQDVLAPLGHEEIGISIIIEVARANALAPTGMRQPGFGGYIFELEAAEVVIEKVCGRGQTLIKPIAIHQKNIGQPIIVVVEDRNPISGRLDDKLLAFLRSRNIDSGQSGLSRQVFVPHYRRFHSGG